MKITSIKLLGTALASAFLVSCGGESTNLPDPARPVVSTCTSETCISGIFVADGVVEGLNYECGNIRSKTSFQGVFSCPLDAASNKVTFLITHSETGNKVTLGEYTFRPVFTSITTYDDAGTPSTTSSYQVVPSQVPDKRVYVTPRELTNEQFSDGFSDRALSITALLHSLDTDFTVGAPVSPANIVNLSETNKQIFLKGLVTSGTDPSIVTSTDVAFRDLVNPGLEAISASRKLPAAGADMSAYTPIAQQATHALAAGVYHSNEPEVSLYTGVFSSGFKLLDETADVGTSFNRMPFAAKSTNNTFYGYMSVGVDRSGRLFGFGATEMRLAGVEQSDPLALIPAKNQMWPNSGNLKDLVMGLQNSNGTARTETIVMKQGVVDQGSMANDPEVYKSFFGVDASVDTRLGRWEMRDGNAVLLGGNDLLPPRMELRHKFNAFPILNPEVWNGISFPIHLKAVITEGCGTTSCATVEVNFSVLADGNIISDKDANCASVNAQLIDATSSTQELPIGVVTRAFVNDGAGATGGHYLIPMILIPSELISTTETRQIEIGTSVPARLRVDSTHFGEIYGNASEVEDQPLDWIDFYVFQKRFGPTTQAGSTKETGKMTTQKAACAP